MVHHKQPKSLYHLCHTLLCEYLGDKVVNAGYDRASSNNQTLSTVRLRLRPFFVEQIPVLVRTSLLEATAEFLLQKSMLSDSIDYGRSVLYLLYLLLSREVRTLKVTLCCYYGCRDMEGALRCIKKNGGSLERLELCRSSLLRMDPLLFRNVLTSSARLTHLVVKNICSDAMLKLIGCHCCSLQHLDISNSKQVSDMGIESLCCQVQIRDKRDVSSSPTTTTTNANGEVVGGGGGQVEVPFRTFDQQQSAASNMTVQEDFGDGSGGRGGGCGGEGSSSSYYSVGCGGGLIGSATAGWRRSIRRRVRQAFLGVSGGGNCERDAGDDEGECLVEIKQVLHPICFTLKVFDITDTSVTNAGLHVILTKISHLHSLGEYCLSDHFLRGLNASFSSSSRSDKFGLTTAHTRKVSNSGMYTLVHVLPFIHSLTCWEPLFDLSDLFFLHRLKQLTLLRLPFCQTVVQQILRYVENPKAASRLEKISLEFVLQEEYLGGGYHHHNLRALPPELAEFDVSRIFNCCDHLKVFTVEFKDSLMLTPPVGYSGFSRLSQPLPARDLHCLSSLVHVQLGQIVLNSAVAAILLNCPHLRHLHCNNCPDLDDRELGALALRSACAWSLQCFYVYEAPLLTFAAFQTLVECFPNLERFGNLTRWAVNCEGIQQVLRTIRDQNYELAVLCGSHWFASECSRSVALSS